MTELTPEKIREISTLLSTAPPETAARLLAMFERMKVRGSEIIPSSDLIAAMREAGMTNAANRNGGGVRLPSFERLFFEPFESLFETGTLDTILPGSLPRAGLKKVWLLVAGRFVPDEVVDLEPHATSAVLRGDMERARAYALELRTALRQSLAGCERAAIVALANSVEDKEVLSRLMPLLHAEAIGRDIWESASGSRCELNEAGIAALSANVRHLEDIDPDAARELLLLTMATLPRPYEAMRVLNRVSYGVDDRRLDITEFAVIGRRLIATAKRAADAVEDACTNGITDGLALANTVERYNQCMFGLEREAKLAADGPWRRETLAIRHKVGNRLDTLCHRATLNLEAALPVERMQRHSLAWTLEPKLHHEPDVKRVEAAAQSLAFVANARLFAPLAGFGVARDSAAKHANTHLNTVCDAVLQAARVVSKPTYLQQWVQATATLVEAFEGVKAAHVFERRANSAATAA